MAQRKGVANHKFKAWNYIFAADKKHYHHASHIKNTHKIEIHKNFRKMSVTTAAFRMVKTDLSLIFRVFLFCAK